MNIIKLLPLCLLVGAPTLMALSQARLNEIGRFAKDTAALDIAKAEQYLNDVKTALPSAGRGAAGTLKQYHKQLEKKIVTARQAQIDDAKKEIVELKKIVPAIPAADIKAIENVVNNAKPDQNEDEFLKSLHKNELFKAREAALRISKVAPSSAIHKTLRTPPPSLSLPIFTDKPIIRPGTPPPTIPLPVKPGTPVVTPSGLPLPIAPGTPAVFDPNMPLPPAPGTAEPILPEPGSILLPPLPGATDTVEQKLVIPTPPPFPGTKHIAAPVYQPVIPTESSPVKIRTTEEIEDQIDLIKEEAKTRLAELNESLKNPSLSGDEKNAIETQIKSLRLDLRRMSTEPEDFLNEYESRKDKDIRA